MLPRSPAVADTAPKEGKRAEDPINFIEYAALGKAIAAGSSERARQIFHRDARRTASAWITGASRGVRSC